jgi:hypothetical protein
MDPFYLNLWNIAYQIIYFVAQNFDLIYIVKIIGFIFISKQITSDMKRFT